MHIRDLPSAEKIIQHFNQAIVLYISEAVKEAEEKRTTGLFSNFRPKMTPNNGYWTPSVNRLQSFLDQAQVKQYSPVYIVLKAHALLMSADMHDFRIAMLNALSDMLEIAVTKPIQSRYGTCFMGYKPIYPLNIVIESLHEQYADGDKPTTNLSKPGSHF